MFMSMLQAMLPSGDKKKVLSNTSRSACAGACEVDWAGCAVADSCVWPVTGVIDADCTSLELPQPDRASTAAIPATRAGRRPTG